MSSEPPDISRDKDRDQAHASIERDTNEPFGNGILGNRDLSNVTGPGRMNTDIPRILPREKVFPIQIGNQLFRLSGASISSDGMSSDS